MAVSANYVVVCVILWLFYFECSLMLSLDSKGVCSVKISTPRTRTKYYTAYSNKWCGKKKCIIKKAKKETYSVTTEQTVCCNGYQYNSDTDVCIPQCSTGCQGGFCIEPEVCECTPPAYLEDNTCKTTSCQCTNGICEGDTCKCLDNHSKFNSTYCSRITDDEITEENSSCVPKCEVGFTCEDNICEPVCDDEFEVYDGGNCIPKCNEGDMLDKDSNCVPNCTKGFVLDDFKKCVPHCKEGYTLDENSKCVPKCDEGNIRDKDSNCVPYCTEGFVLDDLKKCVPHYMQNVCKEGYTLDENSNCVPKCVNCTNGNCTEPNICTCKVGFNLDNDGICIPKCNPVCQNGNCTIIDDGTSKCHCRQGYELSIEGVCELKCDCANGFCNEAGFCYCYPGFSEENRICRPICSKTCVNSTCTAPDVCTCLDGFEKDVDNDEVCRPVCVGPDCRTNDCSKPKYLKVNKTRNKTKLITLNKMCGWRRRCTAKKTYVEHYTDKVPTPTCCEGWEYVSETDTCRPQCKFGCDNGTCTAPDICICNVPLVLNDQHKCVEPVCEDPCINSQCTANNTCICNIDKVRFNSTHCIPLCYDGYEVDSTTLECVPKCDDPCFNGTCTEPNVCTCNKGYKSINGKCEPNCEPECENADCIAPNTCLCKTGFVFQDVNQRKCIPFCEKCDNGICIEPNNCQCNKGYAKTDGICTPVCNSTCQNGFCSNPDVCTCNEGYNFDPDTISCQPICSPTCINATCIAPDTCNCTEGHEKTEETNICRPKCGNCENGDCVAPNNCVCHKNYQKEDNICKPQCDKNCTNGFCSEPNTCTCHLGYNLDKNDKYNCRPSCDPECINSICESPNKCTCLFGYEISKNIWTCTPKCDSCYNGTCIKPNICQCGEGYRLNGNYCVPICNDKCENGFCSGPDKCTCFEGYVNDLNPAKCLKPCKNCSMGTCSTHGECTCFTGFVLENDVCVPTLPVECSECNGTCDTGSCLCGDGKVCFELLKSAETITTPKLAGLEISWVIGGGIGVLMVLVMLFIIRKTWIRRKQRMTKSPVIDGNVFGSVAYTRPDTLVRGSNGDANIDIVNKYDIDNEGEETSDPLLNVGEVIELRKAAEFVQIK